MPAKNKETGEKLLIRNFKDGSSHFWCGFAHFYLDENNNLLWASGEQDNPQYRTAMEAYIKRNKKSFKPRLQVIEVDYR